MDKKAIIIVVAIAVVTGFISGYFSGPVGRYLAGLDFPEFEFKKISWFSGQGKNKSNVNTAAAGVPDVVDSVKGPVQAKDAVNAVKSLPAVSRLAAAAASKGCQVTFRADQPPTEEYPVWLVEMRQVYPNQIPDILFLKVDGNTGKVLDLQTEELYVAGFRLSSPQPTNSQAGKLLQSKSVYNDNLKRKVRLERYKGLQVESDRSKKVVVRITVTGQEVKGPRELTVGADVADVVKKFGKANIAQEDLLIYNALDDKNLQAHIKLEKGKVSSFSLVKVSE